MHRSAAVVGDKGAASTHRLRWLLFEASPIPVEKNPVKNIDQSNQAHSHCLFTALFWVAQKRRKKASIMFHWDWKKVALLFSKHRHFDSAWWCRCWTRVQLQCLSVWQCSDHFKCNTQCSADLRKDKDGSGWGRRLRKGGLEVGQISNRGMAAASLSALLTYLLCLDVTIWENNFVFGW